jgi:hypothetical protein
MSRYRNENLKKRYGITEEEYDKLKEKQRHKCKICSRYEDLYVDHDHDAGHIRGLLCHKCNSALGFLQDDIARAFKAIWYLIRTKIIPNINNFL